MVCKREDFPVSHSLRGIFKRVSDAAGLWGVWLGVAREVRVGGGMVVRGGGWV